MTTIATFPGVSAARPSRAPSAASAPVSPRLELTRRGRLLRSLVILALLVFVALTLVSAAGMGPAAAGWLEGPQLVSVTVQPGDTLWGYAVAYAPEGVDPRDYVLQVQQVNGLSTTQVTVGTQIDLPVEG